MGATGLERAWGSRCREGVRLTVVERARGSMNGGGRGVIIPHTSQNPYSLSYVMCNKVFTPGVNWTFWQKQSGSSIFQLILTRTIGFFKDMARREYHWLICPRKIGFKLSEKAITSFNELKLAMTSLPILRLPKFSKLFVIETDASGAGIGARLTQENRPIDYISKGSLLNEVWFIYTE